MKSEFSDARKLICAPISIWLPSRPTRSSRKTTAELEIGELHRFANVAPYRKLIFHERPEACRCSGGWFGVEAISHHALNVRPGRGFVDGFVQLRYNGGGHAGRADKADEGMGFQRSEARHPGFRQALHIREIRQPARSGDCDCADFARFNCRHRIKGRHDPQVYGT